MEMSQVYFLISIFGSDTGNYEIERETEKETEKEIESEYVHVLVQHVSSISFPLSYPKMEMK
jgi:hypothetical protein